MTSLDTTPSGERLEAVTIWYLESRSPADLRPATRPVEGLAIVSAQIPQPEFNRFLYASVGGDWYWRDRLLWDYDHWLQMIARPGYETWVAWLRGSPAGYYELDPDGQGNVEIAYFGLLPAFVGMGLGGRLLTHAVERAWEKGATRVWVHTCSLDHPAALRNYQARGLRIYEEETLLTLLPALPVGPWPGANRAAQPST